MHSCINDVANKNFYGKPDTPREVLLKQLDGAIKFIPIIDEKGNFKSFLDKDSLPKKLESKVFIDLKLSKNQFWRRVRCVKIHK